MEQIKNALIKEANNSKYGGQVDRSNWIVGIAKKDIVQRGVLCLKKGEQVLLNPNSIMKNSRNQTVVSVYLAKNLGGIDTSRYAAEFEIV
jgi:hypothetical protein